jgi:hypothetical protein
MRERWGTFSVSDHVNNAPFVSDVLLFDRLLIPIPDPKDPNAEKEWICREWQPELLHDCLNILGVKTEKEEGLALTIPWDKSKRERFQNKMSTSAALAMQERDPEKDYYNDPSYITRLLIQEEFRPALPRGVSKAWTVAAYPSAGAYRRDIENEVKRPDCRCRPELAALLRHKYLTPVGSDPDHEMLKRAVDLA